MGSISGKNQYDVEISVNSKKPKFGTGSIFYIDIDDINLIEDCFIKSEIKPIDLKSKVIISFDQRIDKKILLSLYSFLVGMSGRRLDFGYDSNVVNVDLFYKMSLKVVDSGKNEDIPERVTVGTKTNSSDLIIDYKSEITPEIAAQIRYSKELLIRESKDNSNNDLLNFIIISSIRVKNKAENMPFFIESDGNEVDLDSFRKRGSEMKKTIKSDDRSEIVDKLPLTKRQESIIESDSANMEKVLLYLNSTHNEETGFWRCTRPENHKNGDANPSMVLAENRSRCFRCDTEDIGPVRILVDTLKISPDDAVELIKGIY